MHAHIHTYIYTSTRIRTYIHTYIHACIHTYMHTYIHSYTHTLIRTYIHIPFVHIYIYISIYIVYVYIHRGRTFYQQCMTLHIIEGMLVCELFFLKLGLVSAILSSWENDVVLDMVAANTLPCGSYNSCSVPYGWCDLYGVFGWGPTSRRVLVA